MRSGRQLESGVALAICHSLWLLRPTGASKAYVREMSILVPYRTVISLPILCLKKIADSM